MSYPDITLIRDICAILQVSEHELLTASEDVEARTAETLAKKYLSLLRRLRWIQYILYGGTALICLICNLAVGHTLDWFWLVLTGELVGASLTLLPILVKQYRGVITLGGFTLSLELLLLAACLFSGGDWFLLASAGVLLGLGAAFLPGALRQLPRPLGEHKAVLYLGTETLLLCALLWVSCAYDGADWFPIPTLPAVLFGLTLPWAWVLICRYAHIESIANWEGDATRWLNFGFVSFQPSEIAKFALIVLFAHMISRNLDRMDTFRYGVVPYVAIMGLVAALIFLESHLSATLIILALGAIMMFVGGTKPRWFLIGGVLVSQMGVGSNVTFSATPTTGAVLVSFGVSVGIGILFGYLPANKAAKLNPIDALRYD